MEFHESYRFENVSIQNTTKINDSRFVDYLQDSDFTLLNASHNGVAYVFHDWIYNVEFINKNNERKTKAKEPAKIPFRLIEESFFKLF